MIQAVGADREDPRGDAGEQCRALRDGGEDVAAARGCFLRFERGRHLGAVHAGDEGQRNSSSSPLTDGPVFRERDTRPGTISRTAAGTSTSPGPPTDITRAAVFTDEAAGLAAHGLELAEAHPCPDLDPELRTASAARPRIGSRPRAART